MTTRRQPLRTYLLHAAFAMLIARWCCLCCS